MTIVAVRLALVGFVDPALSMLELFLNRDRCNFILVAPDQAEAIIYNADQPIQLEKLHEKYIEAYDKPGILVSIKDVSWSKMIALKKPYTQQTLSSALTQLRTLLATGNTAPRYAGERTQQENAQILADFRQQIMRGRGEDSIELKQIRQQADQRKDFQERLLARKHSTEQALAQLKPGMPAGSYTTQSTVSVTGQDILDTTAEFIAEHIQAIELVGQDQPQSQPTVELTPATPQEIRDCCGNSPDLNLNIRNQRLRLIFNPEGQLLSLVMAAIQRAHQEDVSIMITGAPGLHLVYTPDSRKFYSGINEDFLVQMAHVRFQFGELKLKTLSNDYFKRMRMETDFAYYPANQLLWKLACWSSRGRVIGEIDIEARYQLERQPEASALIGLPHTQQFIDLWLEQPLTVQQVIDRSGAKQRHVFPFMTAAWVLKCLLKQ